MWHEVEIKVKFRNKTRNLLAQVLITILADLMKP